MTKTLDIVFVEGLACEASIGVFDWERSIKQSLVIDLELGVDFSVAAESDSIEHAVSYAEVSAFVITLIQSKHHDLLEHLAEKISQAIFQAFPIKTLRLKLAKPGAVAEAKTVGVKIARERS